MIKVYIVILVLALTSGCASQTIDSNTSEQTGGRYIGNGGNSNSSDTNDAYEEYLKDRELNDRYEDSRPSDPYQAAP